MPATAFAQRASPATNPASLAKLNNHVIAQSHCPFTPSGVQSSLTAALQQQASAARPPASSTTLAADQHNPVAALQQSPPPNSLSTNAALTQLYTQSPSSDYPPSPPLSQQSTQIEQKEQKEIKKHVKQIIKVILGLIAVLGFLWAVGSAVPLLRLGVWTGQNDYYQTCLAAVAVGKYWEGCNATLAKEPGRPPYVKRSWFGWSIAPADMVVPLEREGKVLAPGQAPRPLILWFVITPATLLTLLCCLVIAFRLFVHLRSERRSTPVYHKMRLPPMRDQRKPIASMLALPPDDTLYPQTGQITPSDAITVGASGRDVHDGTLFNSPTWTEYPAVHHPDLINPQDEIWEVTTQTTRHERPIYLVDNFSKDRSGTFARPSMGFYEHLYLPAQLHQIPLPRPEPFSASVDGHLQLEFDPGIWGRQARAHPYVREQTHHWSDRSLLYARPAKNSMRKPEPLLGVSELRNRFSRSGREISQPWADRATYGREHPSYELNHSLPPDRFGLAYPYINAAAQAEYIKSSYEFSSYPGASTEVMGIAI